MEYSCLIIDDEESIAQAVCEYFNMFDVPSSYVTSYEEGIAFLDRHRVSVVLLDINLGENSGFELCKTLRKKLDIPVLFLSARTSDDDVLTALNLGGDDYIKKPFRLNILLAKVKAVLRRCKENSALPTEASRSAAPVALDRDRRQVLVNGTPVKLKEMEYRLLEYLTENEGRVVTKEELFENVWEDRFTGDGTLSVHIRYLRRKIEKDPNRPQYIKTVWGVGYLYEVNTP